MRWQEMNQESFWVLTAELPGKLRAGNISALCFSGSSVNLSWREWFIHIINIRFWHKADIALLVFRSVFCVIVSGISIGHR